MTPTPRIESVQPTENMLLHVRFVNGEQRIYNCEPLTSRPQFKLLTVPAFFHSVHVDPGGYGISWNDDVDLSEYELWMNGSPLEESEETGQQSVE